MIAQTRRDPWQVIWQVATSDHSMTVLLLGIAVGLVIMSWLPQMPTADLAAYAQWLSEAHARYGKATSTLQTLGLFTITRSFGFRALLALLAGCLLLRLMESGNRLWRNREMAEPAGEWQPLADVRWPDVMSNLHRQRYRVVSAPPLFQADRWPWADLFPLLAHGSALLLLVGLLLSHVWGWRVEGLIVPGGERIALPDAEKWVALDKDARKVTNSPGIVTFVEERGPGVRVSAAASSGRLLSLQQTAEAAPVTQPTVALTEDRYFAIPEAQLILRLTPQPGRAIEAHSPVLVQVYRSLSGQLITETVVEGDVELAVDDVTLEFASAPYARLTASFNPGLWPTGAGLVFLVVGLVGGTAWPVRRLWLREGTERLETTGDLLLVLTGVREG